MKRKILLAFSVILLIFIILVSVNTNSNTVIIVDRILNPLRIDDITIYFSGIPLIILLFFTLIFLLKALKVNMKKINILILAAALLFFTRNTSNKALEIRRFLVNDVTSISLEEGSLRTYEKYDNRLHTLITLDNQGRDTRTFSLKLIIPSKYSDKDLIIDIRDDNNKIKEYEIERNQKLYVKERIDLSNYGIILDQYDNSLYEFQIIIVENEDEFVTGKVYSLK